MESGGEAEGGLNQCEFCMIWEHLLTMLLCMISKHWWCGGDAEGGVNQCYTLIVAEWTEERRSDVDGWMLCFYNFVIMIFIVVWAKVGTGWSVLSNDILKLSFYTDCMNGERCVMLCDRNNKDSAWMDWTRTETSCKDSKRTLQTYW